MKIIAATNNAHKVKEIEQMLSPLGFEVITQKEAGIDIEVEETGDSFAKNALLKARAVALLSDEYVLADDSGLCVDALGGKPGVHSARYAGDGASDADKINKLLGELEGVEDRSAKFVTDIAFITPDKKEIITQGEVQGTILKAPVGNNGFGYDPIFFAAELGKSFAAATSEEKNSVSHRSRALMALYEEITEADLIRKEQ